MADERELVRELGETLKAFQERMARALTGCAVQLSPWREACITASAFIQDIETVFQKQAAPFLDAMREAFRDLPDKTRWALSVLAQHGWYVDPEMVITLPFDLAKLFDEGKSSEAETFLTDYFERKSVEICEHLSKGFPSRSRIMEAAFKAHRERDFALSVPVFLIQADGICWDLAGVQLYSKRRDGHTTKVMQAISNLELGDMRGALLHAITDVFPIAFGIEERKQAPDCLNRHAVLHGESVSYDTLENSCKAISLLAFTGWILPDAISRSVEQV
jgi:hypothetical protein